MLAWLREKRWQSMNFWRGRLSGTADSGGEHPDDAGRCGRGDAVLGARAWCRESCDAALSGF